MMPGVKRGGGILGVDIVIGVEAAVLLLDVEKDPLLQLELT